MIHREAAVTRTLTVVLPESEWQALRAEEPDAVAWLRAQIRERLKGHAPAPVRAAAAQSDSWDDY